jgi:hypothetical protein
MRGRRRLDCVSMTIVRIQIRHTLTLHEAERGKCLVVGHIEFVGMVHRLDFDRRNWHLVKGRTSVTNVCHE